jgi:uncharacterized protein YyaL (SSP411 family)
MLREDYFDMALGCLRALQQECWQGGRLLAQSRSSGKSMPAYLDDYAQLLQAVLDCLEYRWHGADLAFAVDLAEQLLEYFADSAFGGFYFTASDYEQLIQRPKSWQDDAMPSGNANAAMGLNRLGVLIGSTRFTDAAEKALQSVADNVNDTPLHAASFVALLETMQRPPLQIIVRADTAELDRWRERILPRLRPSQSAYFIAREEPGLPAGLADKITPRGAAAFVCEGFSCRPPRGDIEQVLQLIDD